MKKTKLLGMLVVFAVCALFFSGCGNAAGGDDSSGGSNGERTKVEGKIGEYGYPYEVGDIVFKDGSATRATDLTDAQKAAAIAVIFYRGNQLNSDDANGNAVTDKERILGVGLSQSHSNMGNYWGSGYGATRDMTSIKCSVRGEKGNWVISGDKDGHDNLYQMAVELKSYNDVYATVDRYYAAFLFALHYAEKTTNQLKNTPYENGWYLPSIAELYYLWKEVDVVNKASKLCGGETFGDSDNIAMQEYWSSSKSTTEAEIYTFSFDRRDNKLFDCEIDSVKRDSFIRNLCAIRDFTEGVTVPVIPRPDAEEGKLGLYGKPYELNDIMLSDGSVIPYKPGLVLTDEQKAAVQSIIFYIGSNKFDGNDKEPSCTLGLGLEESSGKLKWCTADAHLYEEAFTYSKCTVNGNAGNHTFIGNNNNLNGQYTFGYLKSANYYYDKNCLDVKYPAFWFASQDDPDVTGSSASVSDVKPWYLPTIAEMFYVWKAKEDLNEVLDFLEGDVLRTNEIYWSSSQSPESNKSKNAMAIKMSDGDCTLSTDKTTELYVRMIKEYDNMLYSH